jgi:hypothetical protein
MKILRRNGPATEVDGGGPALPASVQRRIEVTVEREIVSVLSRQHTASAAFCADCGCEVSMLSPESAATAAETTPRTIYRWMEEKTVHFIELASGRVLICQESLRASGHCKQISEGEPQ